MTSVLNVDEIAAKDGTSPVALTKQSAAKVWNNFNGTGTIATRDSFNISGMTDVSTGQTKHSFANPMNTSDSFVASGWCRVSGSWGYFAGNNDTPMTASTFEHATLGIGDTQYDAIYATVSINGDLA